MLAKCIHLHRRPWYGTRHTAGLVRGRTADMAFCPAQHWWAHRCWGWVPGQRISSKAFWMLGKCGPAVACKTNWLFLLWKCLKRFQDFWWSKLPRVWEKCGLGCKHRNWVVQAWGSCLGCFVLRTLVWLCYAVIMRLGVNHSKERPNDVLFWEAKSFLNKSCL